MERVITILCFLVAVGVIVVAFPHGVSAILLTAVLSTIIVILIRQNSEDSKFLIQIFLVALLARIIFGTFIHVFNLREFFGGDALTFDSLGNQIVEVWFGQASPNDPWSQRAMDTGTPGWGIHYLTAFIYLVLGRNLLAAQFFCAVIGAATVPVVFSCAYSIFNNKRVARTAAFLVALFPAFIIWSGQLLKDGLIIFLLVLAMTMVLKLQQRLNYSSVLILIIALFGILSLRFYIFYMVAIAVAGSFIVGQSGSIKSIARGFILLVFCGLTLTYLGVLRTATENFDKFMSLERVQVSRDDLARSAESGFGGDVDVSTTEGAISAIPVGLTYLMLAPFPWQVTSTRQAITLPEILVWWAMLPFAVSGIWYTLKNRLRPAIPILIFTVMLMIAYSIFQGNVGTAYRQRTQIQVFLFIFIAVGWSLRVEAKENRDTQRRLKLQQRRSQLAYKR